MADTYHVKDHVVREVVNRLRDTALEFHAHGSLRERLARELEPLLVASRPAEVDDEGLPPLPEQHEELRARWKCDSCDGRGHDGELHYQGEWQPPEPYPCSDCEGAGQVAIDAYTAEQYRQGQRDAVAAYRQKQAALQELADQAQENGMGYGDAVAADRARFEAGDQYLWDRMKRFESVLLKIATVNAMDYEYRKWAVDAVAPLDHTTNKEKTDGC